MPTELLPGNMTAREARALANRIKQHLDDAREDILNLYERKGWRVLGYKSWRECVQIEFGQSQRTLYNQLEAAKVDREICNSCKSGALPLTHAMKLAALPEGTRKEAYEEALAESGGKPTAAKVQEVVDRRGGKDAPPPRKSTHTDNPVNLMANHGDPAGLARSILRYFGGDREFIAGLLVELANHAGYDLTPKE